MTLKNKIYFIIFMILEFIGLLLFFLGFIVTSLDAADNASVPGLIGTHWSALAPVWDMRASMPGTGACVRGLLRGSQERSSELRAVRHRLFEWRELRNKLVRDLLTKAAQATFMGALGFLALAVWKAIQVSVTK